MYTIKYKEMSRVNDIIAFAKYRGRSIAYGTLKRRLLLLNHMCYPRLTIKRTGYMEHCILRGAAGKTLDGKDEMDEYHSTTIEDMEVEFSMAVSATVPQALITRHENKDPSATEEINRIYIQAARREYIQTFTFEALMKRVMRKKLIHDRLHTPYEHQLYAVLVLASHEQELSIICTVYGNDSVMGEAFKKAYGHMLDVCEYVPSNSASLESYVRLVCPHMPTERNKISIELNRNGMLVMGQRFHDRLTRMAVNFVRLNELHDESDVYEEMLQEGFVKRVIGWLKRTTPEKRVIAKHDHIMRKVIEQNWKNRSGSVFMFVYQWMFQNANGEFTGENSALLEDFLLRHQKYVWSVKYEWYRIVLQHKSNIMLEDGYSPTNDQNEPTLNNDARLLRTATNERIEVFKGIEEFMDDLSKKGLLEMEASVRLGKLDEYRMIGDKLVAEKLLTALYDKTKTSEVMDEIHAMAEIYRSTKEQESLEAAKERADEELEQANRVRDTLNITLATAKVDWFRRLFRLSGAVNLAHQHGYAATSAESLNDTPPNGLGPLPSVPNPNTTRGFTHVTTRLLETSSVLQHKSKKRYIGEDNTEKRTKQTLPNMLPVNLEHYLIEFWTRVYIQVADIMKNPSIPDDMSIWAALHSNSDKSLRGEMAELLGTTIGHVKSHVLNQPSSLFGVGAIIDSIVQLYAKANMASQTRLHYLNTVSRVVRGIHQHVVIEQCHEMTSLRDWDGLFSLLNKQWEASDPIPSVASIQQFFSVVHPMIVYRDSTKFLEPMETDGYDTLGMLVYRMSPGANDLIVRFNVLQAFLITNKPKPLHVTQGMLSHYKTMQSSVYNPAEGVRRNCESILRMMNVVHETFVKRVKEKHLIPPDTDPSTVTSRAEIFHYACAALNHLIRTHMTELDKYFNPPRATVATGIGPSITAYPVPIASSDKRAWKDAHFQYIGMVVMLAKIRDAVSGALSGVSYDALTICYMTTLRWYRNVLAEHYPAKQVEIASLFEIRTAKEYSFFIEHFLYCPVINRTADISMHDMLGGVVAPMSSSQHGMLNNGNRVFVRHVLSVELTLDRLSDGGFMTTSFPIKMNEKGVVDVVREVAGVVHPNGGIQYAMDVIEAIFIHYFKSVDDGLRRPYDREVYDTERASIREKYDPNRLRSSEKRGRVTATFQQGMEQELNALQVKAERIQAMKRVLKESNDWSKFHEFCKRGAGGATYETVQRWVQWINDSNVDYFH